MEDTTGTFGCFDLDMTRHQISTLGQAGMLLGKEGREYNFGYGKVHEAHRMTYALF